MARVNVEEEAMTRVQKLSEWMGCSFREALGTAVVLWHGSQDVLATKGTEEQVIDWARLYTESEERQQKWISALQKSRLISPADEGFFLIHGNEIQIANRVSRITKANKAAKAIKKKWREAKTLGELSKNSPRPLEELSENSPRVPMQGSSRQCSSGQSKAAQEVFVPAGSLPTTAEPPRSLGARIFEAYAEAYRRRYGVDPARNASVNSQCSQLGKRLGEEAIEVVRFYVAHNRAFYVQKLHPVGLALSDAESLRTEWLTGRQVTGTEARAAENRQQTVNAFGKFLTKEAE